MVSLKNELKIIFKSFDVRLASYEEDKFSILMIFTLNFVGL